MNTPSSLPSKFLPAFHAVDAVVVQWDRAANGSQNTKDFLGAVTSVICDFADVIVLTDGADVESISQSLKELEVPEDYVQYVAQNKVPNAFHWIFKEKGSSIELVQTHANTNNEQMEFISLLKSQEEFFSAEVDNLDLSCLSSETIEVNDKGVAFMNQSIYSSLATKYEHSSLERLLGISNLFAVEIPPPFNTLSQLMRFAPNSVLLLAQSSDERFQKALSTFKTTIQALLEKGGVSLDIRDLPVPDLPETPLANSLPSYGDFLVINEAVLVPQFDCAQDELALEAILTAYPGAEVFGIPAITADDQIHSLHSRLTCLPEGTLFPVS